MFISMYMYASSQRASSPTSVTNLKSSVMRSRMPLKTMSPEARMSKIKQAAGETSALKNISSREVGSFLVDGQQPSNRATQQKVTFEQNPLRSLSLRKPTNQIVSDKIITAGNRVSNEGVLELVEVIKYKNGLQTVLITDPVTKNLISRVTTDADGVVIEASPTRQAIPRSKRQPNDMQKRVDQKLQTEQALNSRYDARDLAFENIYEPAKVVEHAENNLRSPVSFGEVYKPSAMEFRDNIAAVEYVKNPVLKSGKNQLAFENIYSEAHDLGSALQNSPQLNSRVNPLRATSSRELVVYDPTQKYQQPLDVAQPLVLYEPQQQEAYNYQQMRGAGMLGGYKVIKPTLSKRAIQQAMGKQSIAAVEPKAETSSIHEIE